MKLNKTNALLLWEERYGNRQFAEDFDGALMCRDAYGDPDYFVYRNGRRIYCGWNLHYILPRTHGGTNAVSNLLCTNILTNEAASDKITYWIDNTLYQVKKIYGSCNYEIVPLNV